MIYTAKVHDVLDGSAQVQGTSVLVDRLWPRGVAKTDLEVDLWLKDAAPSPELRKWFGHDPERFDEFSRRYCAELDEGNADVDKLRDLAKAGDVTLLFAAKDRDINHAVVLKGWLE
ncbi:DUF488 family protein [Corynebacterium breve]|uniref:DUF488 family protein n=1 Tax=Corynebacterium breve TaxID=3049799 RepID=A0ABY8VLA4_9CORY|nr:DUF488 family protein [Corynebacterium breve]WIM68330.1 DUF488 family protein [Corynebacterium breve]